LDKPETVYDEQIDGGEIDEDTSAIYKNIQPEKRSYTRPFIKKMTKKPPPKIIGKSVLNINKRAPVSQRKIPANHGVQELLGITTHLTKNTNLVSMKVSVFVGFFSTIICNEYDCVIVVVL